MLIISIVLVSFAIGVISSEDVKSFLKRCLDKVVKFRESAKNEEIKDLKDQLEHEKIVKLRLMGEKQELISDNLALKDMVNKVLKENAELKISKDMQSVE